MELPKLQDHVREFVYRWFLPKVEPCKVLDIGSRDSGLPAYMASQGFDVMGCERDTTFMQRQGEWEKQFDSKVNMYFGEFEDITDQKFDLVLSIFALQHNADNDKDIDCYRHCGKLLKPGGKIFIAHEYRHIDEGGMWIQRGRGDGDMIVYSDVDVATRIIEPIASVRDIKHSEVKFMTWGPGHAGFCEPKGARVACVEITT